MPWVSGRILKSQKLPNLFHHRDTGTQRKSKDSCRDSLGQWRNIEVTKHSKSFSPQRHRDTGTQRHSKGSSRDSLGQLWDVEVDEQANALAREFQVREQLRLMDREHFLHCFEFHDYFILNNQI